MKNIIKPLLTIFLIISSIVLVCADIKAQESTQCFRLFSVEDQEQVFIDSHGIICFK